MKKQPKKAYQLAFETIRQLRCADLAGAAGGTAPPPIGGSNNSCIHGHCLQQ